MVEMVGMDEMHLASIEKFINTSASLYVEKGKIVSGKKKLKLLQTTNIDISVYGLNLCRCT